MLCSGPSFPELREAHVDCILVEELSCNGAFAAWFGGILGIDGGCAHAMASAWEWGRESDVRASYDGSVSTAVLIENKSRSGLSEGQAEHYEVRKAAGLSRGDWDRGMSVLVSPASWASVNPTSGFDAHVSYESIAHHLRSSDDRRLHWKAAVLMSATPPAEHVFSMHERYRLLDEGRDALRIFRSMNGLS